MHHLVSLSLFLSLVEAKKEKEAGGRAASYEASHEAVYEAYAKGLSLCQNYTTIKGKKQCLSLSFAPHTITRYYGRRKKEESSTKHNKNRHHHHHHFESQHATCCFSYGSCIYSGCVS